MPKYKVGDVIKATTTGWLITIKRIDDEFYCCDWVSNTRTYSEVYDRIESLEQYFEITPGVLLTPRVARRLPDWW
jgi:hypothetical protein